MPQQIPKPTQHKQSTPTESCRQIDKTTTHACKHPQTTNPRLTLHMTYAAYLLTSNLISSYYKQQNTNQTAALNTIKRQQFQPETIIPYKPLTNTSSLNMNPTNTNYTTYSVTQVFCKYQIHHSVTCKTTSANQNTQYTILKHLHLYGRNTRLPIPQAKARLDSTKNHNLLPIRARTRVPSSANPYT
eukprot:gene3015-1997_t